ncbi:hypothetical protein FBF28_03745 [Candidatus Saccharibacteria bacterium oral taxon 488]|nr:hypothetical protein FBF28_03745 [Candidatus Saccharibacteria bacterium oral taxon 488]
MKVLTRLLLMSTIIALVFQPVVAFASDSPPEATPPASGSTPVAPTHTPAPQPANPAPSPAAPTRPSAPTAATPDTTSGGTSASTSTPAPSTPTTTPSTPAPAKPTPSEPPAPSAAARISAKLLITKVGLDTAHGTYVELYNPSSGPVNIAGWTLQYVSQKGQVTTLKIISTELVVPAGGALVVGDSRLTDGRVDLRFDGKKVLAKTGGGEVYALDAGGNEIDQTSFAGLAKGSSWSLLDGEWKVTFSPTPARPNEFKQWPDCKAGYVHHQLTGECVKESVPMPCRPGQYRSPATGHCRNIVNEPELAPCKSGQYRSPETGRCRNIGKLKTQTPCREGYYRSEITGRCRSIASAAAKTLKPCPDGQFRNPATGRCKKIAADSDVLKECAEGFERNPKTKRCRKVALATAPKTGFAPEQVKQVTGAMWGWWVLGGVSLLAVGYAGWQWRWEIGRAAAWLKHAITRGKR